jgi:hypothetical protein
MSKIIRLFLEDSIRSIGNPGPPTHLSGLHEVSEILTKYLFYNCNLFDV